jgi:hypothetical protein
MSTAKDMLSLLQPSREQAASYKHKTPTKYADRYMDNRHRDPYVDKAQTPHKPQQFSVLTNKYIDRQPDYSPYSIQTSENPRMTAARKPVMSPHKTATEFARASTKSPKLSSRPDSGARAREYAARYQQNKYAGMQSRSSAYHRL